MRLVLGSGSPRRLELLAQIGVAPDEVRAPDIDEDPRPRELPLAYVRRIAAEKLEAVTAAPDELVLCADTTVALGRRIMGKPETADDAAAFLRAMSGRRHRVMTAVGLRLGDRRWYRDVTTQVKVKVLTEEDIARYLATGDWHGKAGAYAIQGPASAFIPWISGSFSAVVGLPLHETAMLLDAAGYRARDRA